MSISNGTPTARDGESQDRTQGVYEKVKGYIFGLPQMCGKKLTEHAAHTLHEDCQELCSENLKPGQGSSSAGFPFWFGAVEAVVFGMP